MMATEIQIREATIKTENTEGVLPNASLGDYAASRHRDQRKERGEPMVGGGPSCRSWHEFAGQTYFSTPRLRPETLA